MKKLLSFLLLSFSVSCTSIIPGGLSTVFHKEDLHPLPYKASGDYLSVLKNDKYRPFYVKGINLGVALPQ